MPSPDKEQRRNKTALAADKLFGKRNISPIRQRPSPSPIRRTDSKPMQSPARASSPPAKGTTSSSQLRPSKLAQPSAAKHIQLFTLSQVENLIDKLIKNREHICSYLELYDLLCANGAPMRCLVHNNFASLYCENEQKQLCVNCVYGNVQHKLHRVVPVKNVMSQIALDIDMMSKKIGKIAEGIEELERTVHQNLIDTEQQLGLSLKSLDLEFERIQKAIHQKYSQCHALIIENFAEAKIKNEILMQQVRVLRDIYNDKIKHTPRGDDELVKLYQHMVLGVLVNQADKFDNKVLKRLNFEEVRNLILKDFTRIREQSEASLQKVIKPLGANNSVTISHNSSQSKFL